MAKNVTAAFQHAQGGDTMRLGSRLHGLTTNPRFKQQATCHWFKSEVPAHTLGNVILAINSNNRHRYPLSYPDHQVVSAHDMDNWRLPRHYRPSALRTLLEDERKSRKPPYPLSAAVA